MPTSSSPSLLDAAADGFAWVDGEGVEFLRTDRYTLRKSSGSHSWAGLCLRQRIDDVDQALADVRTWLRERGQGRYLWSVADSATPADLVQQLLDRGLTSEPSFPTVEGMILRQAPEPVDGIEVRRVETMDDRLAALDVAAAAFGWSDDDRLAARARAERRGLEASSERGDFIAFLDGEAVGSGETVFIPCGAYLLGGTVLEHARGRGVYRALVRARWEAAAERGTPALVVQAGPMSAPILARLGFETVCRAWGLVDEAGG